MWQPTRGSAWSGPAVLGGITAIGNPDAMLGNDGALTAFVRGSDNRAWTFWQTSVGGPWAVAKVNDDDQAVRSDVRVIDSAGGAGSVFAIDGNGHLRTSWQSGPGSGWSGWADLGGSLVS